MPEPLTAADARRLLDVANPDEWTVEFVQPPEGRPGDPAALLRALFTPAARVLDQGGRGIVAEVTVEADAALIAAAPDLAAALIAVTEELRESERETWETGLEGVEALRERDEARTMLADCAVVVGAVDYSHPEYSVERAWPLARDGVVRRVHEDERAWDEVVAERDALVQTSGDLCPVCGWRGIRGHDPCAFCAAATLRAERDAARATLAEVAWRMGAIDNQHPQYSVERAWPLALEGVKGRLAQDDAAWDEARAEADAALACLRAWQEWAEEQPAVAACIPVPDVPDAPPDDRDARAAIVLWADALAAHVERLRGALEAMIDAPWLRSITGPNVDPQLCERVAAARKRALATLAATPSASLIEHDRAVEARAWADAANEVGIWMSGRWAKGEPSDSPWNLCGEIQTTLHARADAIEKEGKR